MSNFPTKQSLKLSADLCVKCGVCLPHCPTYAIRKEETESPRGRITLMQGLATEQLKVTEEVRLRLSHCLSCGRCEQVCPAKVPYTSLMDGSRALFATTTDQNRSWRLFIARTLASPGRLKVLSTLAALAQKMRVSKLISPASRLGRVLAWLPPRSHAKKTSNYPLPYAHTDALESASVSGPAQAILFAGCLTSAFERDIIRATVTVGHHLGVTLQVSNAGVCCGALYQHVGDNASAQKLTQQSISAFTTSAPMPVASLLSGCGRGLLDNLRLSDDKDAAALIDRIIDVHVLLRNASNTSSASIFLPAKERIAVYFPCTASREHAQAVTDLLKLVPNIDLTELGQGFGCCGASGDHMVVDTAAADKLARPVVDELLHSGATCVLINNLGCAWHLRSQLALADNKIKVLHPMQWLAEQTRHPVSS